MYVHIQLTPPTLAAWSMAGLLYRVTSCVIIFTSDEKSSLSTLMHNFNYVACLNDGMQIEKWVHRKKQIQ